MSNDPQDNLLERLSVYAEAGYGHSVVCKEARDEILKLAMFQARIFHIMEYNPNSNDACDTIDALIDEAKRNMINKKDEKCETEKTIK
tara:strand:+ start:2290 stop:2553 length:264 start_codon:yes stop_codon:yes gene_type:complete